MIDIISMSKINRIVKPVITPANFSWQDHPLVGRIWRDDKENYHTNYDVSVKQLKGKTYYVDQNNGNDANDGLTPKTSFAHLLTAYNKPDVKVIVLCNTANFNYGFNGTVINKDLTIKTLYNSRQTIHNYIYADWVKTTGATNVYQQPGTNIYAVIDRKRKDEYGNFLGLSLANSVSDCDSKPDSCWIDSTNSIVYANISTGDYGRTITIRNDRNAIDCNLSSNTLYLENIDIVGGFSALGTGNIYAKNCTFQYGNGASFNADGSILTIVQNCVASKAYHDGFSGANGAKIIEIGCTGRNNGNAGNNGVDNGSTTHGGSHTIRLNGEYHHNYGPNVADVQDATESWCIGCNAHDSLANVTTQTHQSADFQTQDAVTQPSKMFLEGCKGYNSYDSIRANSVSNMYVHNCKFETYSIGTTTANIEEY